MKISSNLVLESLQQRIGQLDALSAKIIIDFLEVLLKNEFQLITLNNKINLYYNEYGICSLHFQKNSCNLNISLNKLSISTENLIQKKKTYFNKYWKDNIFKKSFILSCTNSNLDELLEGIAVAISTFLSGIDEATDSKTISQNDVRFTSTEEEGAPIFNPHPPTVLYYKTKFINKSINWSRTRTSFENSKLTIKDSNIVTNVVHQLVEDILSNAFHISKKPLFETYEKYGKLSLIEKIEKFSNLVKEYLAKPEQALKVYIEDFYIDLIPSLPEDSPRRRAIDSLRGLIK